MKFFYGNEKGEEKKKERNSEIGVARPQLLG
jgi:hypothetical protein